MSMHPVQNENSQIPLLNQVFNSICIEVQEKNYKIIRKQERCKRGCIISGAQFTLCTRLKMYTLRSATFINPCDDSVMNNLTIL